jgi:hypothetical protein
MIACLVPADEQDGLTFFIKQASNPEHMIGSLRP